MLTPCGKYNTNKIAFEAFRREMAFFASKEFCKKVKFPGDIVDNIYERGRADSRTQ